LPLACSSDFPVDETTAQTKDFPSSATAHENVLLQELPNLEIQLQVDPCLQQNLLSNPLNQPQALITGRPRMSNQELGMLPVQGYLSLAYSRETN